MVMIVIMSAEGIRIHETAAEADFEQIGRKILEQLGVEDPTFGNIAMSAGDPEGMCVGTLAEAVGRHDAVRTTVTWIVEDAHKRGVDPEEAAKQHPLFDPYLAKDEAGVSFKVGSSEELKKNS